MQEFDRRPKTGPVADADFAHHLRVPGSLQLDPRELRTPLADPDIYAGFTGSIGGSADPDTASLSYDEVEKVRSGFIDKVGFSPAALKEMFEKLLDGELSFYGALNLNGQEMKVVVWRYNTPGSPYKVELSRIDPDQRRPESHIPNHAFRFDGDGNIKHTYDRGKMPSQADPAPIFKALKELAAV
ncbi:MAG: hypothetical protein D6719_07985 [Candidatus Dadabacteria bacterium]|nr:MAG: hypothetical protein D6719_07985 [Candidatus Dadabacteria bacterium]